MPGRVQKVSRSSRRGLRSRVKPEKKAFARQLRNNPTGAFVALWSALRRKQLGARVHRRAILYGWIPDFWCPAHRLAIDIDYPSDQIRMEELARRDEVLSRYGVTVIRIPAHKVFNELPAVMQYLKAKFDESNH